MGWVCGGGILFVFCMFLYIFYYFFVLFGLCCFCDVVFVVVVVCDFVVWWFSMVFIKRDVVIVFDDGNVSF